MMADSQSAAPQSVRDLGILLVEDDSATRTAISRMLYDLGVRGVWEARDGVHALELLQQHGGRINLVICDLEMPRMGGLDMLHALRTSNGSPLTDLPVVVLTAHREADTVKRAIAYEISGYLVKPVSKADLTKRLTFVVQKGR